MERELRQRTSSRRRMDQPTPSPPEDETKEMQLDENKDEDDDDAEHRESREIEKMEADALMKGKEDKNGQEAEGKSKEARGLKRKAEDDRTGAAAESDKDVDSSTDPAADKRSSEDTRPQSDSKEASSAKPADEVSRPSASSSLPSTPARKQPLKRTEPEGPLLSIEEQKLMDTDVLTLLKRFAPKYYVPLPKIWAIPKSQLTTAPAKTS